MEGDRHLERQPLDYAPVGGQTNRLGTCILIMGLYLVVTVVAIEILEPHLTPPGFTGRGFAAMGIILIGAFHAGLFYRSGWVFILFGSLGAMLLAPEYMDSRRGLSIGFGHETIAGILLKWTIFTLAMGAAALSCGWLGTRWRRSKT